MAQILLFTGYRSTLLRSSVCSSSQMQAFRRFHYTAPNLATFALQKRRFKSVLHKINNAQMDVIYFGGENRIRTCETVARLHAFQACAFNHSATSPEVVSILTDCPKRAPVAALFRLLIVLLASYQTISSGFTNHSCTSPDSLYCTKISLQIQKSASYNISILLKVAPSLFFTL